MLNDRYQVARIAIESRGLPEGTRPPLALTFVIDVSGSMDMEGRLELVKEALLLLVAQMAPTDTLAIAVYGTEARVILEPTPIGESESVRDAITSLRPEGATNAEAGLLLGYDLARRAFGEGGVNRVILASDGVANVGNTGPNSIFERIRDEARQGIQLTTVGFGMGNYNDVLMEQLANDGDGAYAYVDSIDEAQRLFVDELNATLVTVALDAKIQVTWDPAAVERYRLIGFENRNLADDEFRDDTVEAGAIGAGHSVTALYELRLADGASGALGRINLRWTDPATNEPIEIVRELRAEELANSFTSTDPHFRLAATAAAFAEVLRESYWAEQVSMTGVAEEALARVDEFPEDPSVRELADLVSRAASLLGE